MLHEKIKLVGAFNIDRSEVVNCQTGTDNFHASIFGDGSFISDITEEDFYSTDIGQEIWIDVELGNDSTGDGSISAPLKQFMLVFLHSMIHAVEMNMRLYTLMVTVYMKCPG